ncbi:MAG: hypothetical protein HQM03_12065 [Magnetococcales bacterium]|nr:hypothetical protein [Magnetococcales bacterium]
MQAKSKFSIFLFIILFSNAQYAKSELLFTTGAAATIGGLSGLTGYYIGQHTQYTQQLSCHPVSYQAEPVCQKSRKIMPEPASIDNRHQQKNNYPQSNTFRIYR